MLVLKVEQLKKGQAFLASISTYTLEMTKREVVGGELLDQQVIALKHRRQPFSVYLNWLEGDVGREVLYIEGANQGRLLAHDGGWKARIPAFWLSPDSSLAMRDSRYPITMAGVQGLLNLMLDVHQQDLATHRIKGCERETGIEFNGRSCDRYTTVYASAEASPTYRKSVTWIDDEWNIPVKSLHYEWPRPTNATDQDLDAITLLESYEFSNIDFNDSLTDLDFDREHPDYRFR